MSQPTYVDLWLVHSILLGCKVNLGYMIIQHILRTLKSPRTILPYGMMLTTIFRHFGFDLDKETEVRMCKALDSINNTYISHLGYIHNRCQWVEKGFSASAPEEIDIDEEVETGIPPPFPHHYDSGTPTLSPPHLVDACSSSASPDWYQHLSQGIDNISLDLHALSEEHDRCFRVFIFCASSFLLLLHHSKCALLYVLCAVFGGFQYFVYSLFCV